MDTSRQDRPNAAYDDDFYAWTQEQAALLKAGRFDMADVANIIEEIETLGRSELSSLRSAYRLIALHLLKMVHQPSHVTASWRSTIVRERGHIEDILQDNPGLRSKRTETLARAYPSARREAADETGLALKTLPAACPFTLDDIERHDIWPTASA